MTRTAVAIRHIPFEDVGIFGDVLERSGYRMQPLEAGLDDLIPARGADLLIVLGGPISANDEADYPFLTAEIRAIEYRLRNDQPVLGICLGAQLMARALGARVYPGPAKEIGWAPVTLTPEGRDSVLAPLHESSLPVLHWHGDTFDLPAGVRPLARTAQTAHQAFAHGATALALQFHLEADPARIEPWLVAYCQELATCGLKPADLRHDTQRFGPALVPVAQRILSAWLAGLPVA
ncbi:MAG: glutamine amidotransferase [Azospirillaceae bacterium]|nr:glutamine amidotransferase [Azospirillaceae bacterium]